jgi:hypothetical protein
MNQPVQLDKRRYELELRDKISFFDFHGKRIPYYMQEHILNYILYGWNPGDFLTGIITNDLKKACYHADSENLWIIPVYAAFFYNYAPIDCWGSREAMAEWNINGGTL